MMKKNLILIGFMGAGKTSVGQALAGKLGWPLSDTDQMIENEAGMPIARIFEEKGEQAFREIETAVLKRLIQEADEAVISVGGGLPLREENRRLLDTLGQTVFLQVKPETVIARLAGDTTRPLLSGDHVEERVRELLVYRNPIYRDAAGITVDVDGKEVSRIAEEICREAGL